MDACLRRHGARRGRGGAPRLQLGLDDENNFVDDGTSLATGGRAASRRRHHGSSIGTGVSSAHLTPRLRPREDAANVQLMSHGRLALGLGLVASEVGVRRAWARHCNRSGRRGGDLKDHAPGVERTSRSPTRDRSMSPDPRGASDALGTETDPGRRQRRARQPTSRPPSGWNLSNAAGGPSSARMVGWRSTS